MESLKYIIKSWIDNLDVPPYTITLSEAAEYYSWDLIRPSDTPDIVTPETIRDTWNGIIREMEVE